MDKDKTRRVNVVLPQQQIDALTKIARREKRSFSSVLREAIEDFTGVRDTVEIGPRTSQSDTEPAGVGAR